MFRAFRAIAMVVLGWCLINAPMQAHSQSDALVVAGERIGPIAVGMSQADLLTALGNPTETVNGADGRWISYTYVSVVR